MNDFKIGQQVYCLRHKHRDTIVDMKLNHDTNRVQYKLKDDRNHVFVDDDKFLEIEPIVDKLINDLGEIELRKKEIHKILDGMVL